MPVYKPRHRFCNISSEIAIVRAAARRARGRSELNQCNYERSAHRSPRNCDISRLPCYKHLQREATESLIFLRSAAPHFWEQARALLYLFVLNTFPHASQIFVMSSTPIFLLYALLQAFEQNLDRIPVLNVLYGFPHCSHT